MSPVSYHHIRTRPGRAMVQAICIVTTVRQLPARCSITREHDVIPPHAVARRKDILVVRSASNPNGIVFGTPRKAKLHPGMVAHAAEMPGIANDLLLTHVRR